MASTEEILARVNQRIAEIRARIGSIGSPNQSGTDGLDFLVASRFQDSSIDGRNGNDRIFGGFGNDNLLGGDGNDLIDGGGGNDFIDGGTGNDTLTGNLGNDILDAGTGNDLLDGGQGDDFLFGNDGNDRLTGGPGNDQLFGGNGSDTLIGAGNLTGDIEVDILVGGGDLFTGSTESDGAPDLFVLGNTNGSLYTNSGADNSGGLFDLGDFAVILDFESGIDKIQLSGARASSLDLFIGDPGFGLGDGTYILDNGDLIGVATNVALNGGDFIFV